MRELKLLTKYRHFKDKEYFTLCKSTPVDGDIIANEIGGPCLICNHTENNKVLKYKNITLDTENYEVFVDNKKIPLTYREYEILKLFLENQGKVFTRDNILNSIWSYDYYGDDKIVNTHIKNIRKKLGYDYIETIRGVGYRIAKENKK